MSAIDTQRVSSLINPRIRVMSRIEHPQTGTATLEGMRIGFMEDWLLEPSSLFTLALIEALEGNRDSMGASIYGVVSRIEFVQQPAIQGAFLFDDKRVPLLHIGDALLAGVDSDKVELGRRILRTAGVSEGRINRACQEMASEHPTVIIFSREKFDDTALDASRRAPAPNKWADWTHTHD